MGAFSYWAARGTCSNCRYFTYQGKYEKGCCSWYGTYCHNNESCSHQKDTD